MEGNRWFRSRAEARVKAEISVVCDDGMRQWRPMALGQGWRSRGEECLGVNAGGNWRSDTER